MENIFLSIFLIITFLWEGMNLAYYFSKDLLDCLFIYLFNVVVTCLHYAAGGMWDDGRLFYSSSFLFSRWKRKPKLERRSVYSQRKRKSAYAWAMRMLMKKFLYQHSKSLLEKRNWRLKVNSLYIRHTCNFIISLHLSQSKQKGNK